MINPMFPYCSANIRLNASSVEVLVSSEEFAKSESISLAKKSARLGSSILTIKFPTRPFSKALASSKYFHLMKASPVSLPLGSEIIPTKSNSHTVPSALGHISGIIGILSPIFHPNFSTRSAPATMPIKFVEKALL